MRTDRISVEELVNKTMDFPGACEDGKLEFLSQFALSDSYSPEGILDAIDEFPKGTNALKTKFKQILDIVPKEIFAGPETKFIVKIKKTSGVHRNQRMVAKAIAEHLPRASRSNIQVSVVLVDRPYDPDSYTTVSSLDFED